MLQKFDFDDILIQAASVSRIRSRSEISEFHANKSLPIFASPMDTVVSTHNLSEFTSLNINVCLPRGERAPKNNNTMVFESFSLSQVEQMLKAKQELPNFTLIDIANGHMQALVDITKKLKAKQPNLTLMVGNIANTETFKQLSEAGADFIRVGIGNGAGCLTTQNAAVGYPMASLIKECFDIKTKHNLDAKIVADGGFKDYADIIKGLALGADYIMLGSVLNKAIESCGQSDWKGIPLSDTFAKFLYNKGLRIHKSFRGMSTKEVQKKWGAQTLKTSEGVVRRRKVQYTLAGWVDNLRHYLKSNMSYCNAKSLDEYIGKAEINFITEKAQKRFAK